MRRGAQTVAETDPLVRELAEMVAELAWLLRAFVDGQAAPDAANTLEWISFAFDGMASKLRHELAEVLAQIAREAEPGPRRAILESYPHAFGLADEDDDG